MYARCDRVYANRVYASPDRLYACGYCLYANCLYASYGLHARRHSLYAYRLHARNRLYARSHSVHACRHGLLASRYQKRGLIASVSQLVSGRWIAAVARVPTIWPKYKSYEDQETSLA